MGYFYIGCLDIFGLGIQLYIVRCLFFFVFGYWFVVLGYDVRLIKLVYVVWNGLGFCFRY